MSYGSPPPPPPPPGGGAPNPGDQPEWGQQPHQPQGGQPYGSQPPPPAYGAAPGYGAATSTPPSNNLVLAILSTVLCCIPIGIYAILQANKVNTLWAQGDQAGAHKAAADAKKWSIIAIVSGFVVGVVYFIFSFMVAASGTSTR